MKFRPIVNPTPADLILEQIYELLASGELQPGEQLPPENVLQKSFNVTKQQLKAAFKPLELYGVIEVKPQSGTYVANIYSKILIGLVRNIIDLSEKPDFIEVYEAREVLEVRAAEMAAEHITPAELEHLREIHRDFIHEVENGCRGGELDIFFHMEIMRFSRNKTMISMFSLITRNLVDFWLFTDDLAFFQNPQRTRDTIGEHEMIIAALAEHNAAESGKRMFTHLQNSFEGVK